MSRATQLAAAVLSAVDFVTQSESAESQTQELTEKKIMVILTYLEKTNDGTSQSELPNCKEFFLLEA